jgi:hypothetical protein
VISDSEILAGLAFLASHADPRYREYILIASANCARVRKEAQLDETRLRPVRDMTMSVRLETALIDLKIETIGALERLLQDHRPSDLLESREAKAARFGKKCLKEAREALRSLGLKTGEE